jgi:uncharacterized protein (TIGR00255 family)
VTKRKSRKGTGKTAPVQSMTGFGAAGARAAGFRAEVEMRAVNGRYLSLKVRLPAEYLGTEEELRRLLNGQLGRGNVELRAEVYPEGAAAGVELDPARVAAYVRNWRKVARRLKLEGELRLEALASMPELFAPPRERAAARKALPALSAATAGALEKLQSMRRREGAALARSLERHLAALERLRDKVIGRAPKVAGELAARAGERVRRILEESGAPGGVRPEDVAREAAWLADRTDVSEEMDRLGSHVAQFRGALARGGPVGKRLEFLVQEMHREANTTGSKASDTQVSEAVVEIKLQIEKLREQVQNLL